MKKIRTFTVLIVMIVLAGLLMLYYNSLSLSISNDHIIIDGSIKPDKENKYLVELNIQRNTEETGKHFIFPFANGLGNISFIEEDGFYTPLNVGTWPLMYEIEKLDNIDLDVTGFSIPKSQGEYKMKFTMSKIRDINELEGIHIYYILYEEKYGKKLSWVKKEFIELIL